MLAIVSAEHVLCPLFIGMLGFYYHVIVIVTMLFISIIIIHVKLFNMKAYYQLVSLSLAHHVYS